jgi:pimeloyl-ACP methyl ester carboxylesterase
MQCLSVCGPDRRNPILLILQWWSGIANEAGGTTRSRVQEWDQRGAGKTFAANDPDIVAPTMTLGQMTSDAEEVVRYLQKTYSKKKIILMGHSWGSVLGVRLSQAHPEWFYAYVGVGQIVKGRGRRARRECLY